MKLKFAYKKVPVLIQMEAVECGAACLGMVLSYYNKHIPIEELREKCGVSRDGSKAINIVKAAREYGLNCNGFKAETIDDLKNFRLPLIIFWNFYHFVVVTGIKKNKVYLNDPGSGRRIIPFSDFNDSFTGFGIEAIPTDTFYKSGKKNGLFDPVIKRLSGNYKDLSFLVAISIVLIIPGLVSSSFGRIFIDNILLGNKTSWLYPLISVMFFTAIVIAVSTFIELKYLTRLHIKLAITSSLSLFYHILRLPMNFFSQRYSGEIVNRIGLSDEVASLISEGVITNFINIFLVVFYAALMFQYNFILTLIAVSASLINILLIKYASSKNIEMNQHYVQQSGNFSGVAIGGLQIIETIKATSSESDFFEMFSGYQAKCINSGVKIGSFNIFISSISSFVTSLNGLAILIIGSYNIMDGLLTMGMFLAFQALNSSFESPISGLLGMGNQIQKMNATFNKIDDVMNYRIDGSYNNSAETINGIKLSGYVEMKNISFGYSRLDPPLIEEFNLYLNPGSRVAIVGTSGSGKSTVARILAGLYTQWAGDIFLDGKRVSEYSRECLTNSMAIVDQDIFLFSGTVKENLSMWDNTVTDHSIILAGKDACIHTEITQKHFGYEHELREGGANYSGGQRQRLEIARALVNNPSILILDEATSALDPISEKNIMDNIKKRGCACLIVAHRLSTIRDCEEIIVMDKGKIVERGSHDNLLKNEKGIYSELIKLY